MLQPSTIKFLKDLRKNNNREWFDVNRKRYETAKEDFNQFLATLIKELTKVNKNFAGLEAKDRSKSTRLNSSHPRLSRMPSSA